MYKTHHSRTTFGSWDVEKVHAVVPRSAFWSQNVQNTPFSDHFWKLRCWKSAHCCGLKHILKSKCTKHTILGPLLEVEMLKKCTLLWREAHFEVKMYKTHHSRTTFGSWDVEKVHAVVAWSTFWSQNVQSTPASDHFWKLRCWKSARCCGAKHILKSKCTKHTILGPLLEVEMLKKCTLLWREAHFEVKMYKTHHSRTTFGSWDVEKVHAVVAWSTFWSQNVQNTPFSDHFRKLRCRKSARCCGAKHILKSKCTKHTILGPLLEVEMLNKCTLLWREHILKSKCAKHTILGPLLEVEMLKKCTLLWREAHFEVKMYKTQHSRTTFGSWDVEKVHAVVARSTFWSQNVQNTPFSDHFWKLRCWKSARCCGAKRILKSKCTKHTLLGPLLEVEMLKKCTLLWREAHFEVKMYKAHQLRTTFGSWDVEKVHAVVARTHFEVKMYKTHHSRTTFGSWDVEKVHAVVAGSTFRSQNVQSTRGLDHFWRLRCRFTTLHYITLHYTPLHYAPLHYTTLHNTTTTTTQLHSTTLHYTPLN